MADQNKVTISNTSAEIMFVFDGICRFCLTETKDGIALSEECFFGESMGLRTESVYGFISKLKLIEAEYFKTFPLKICQNCYELIQLFYNFNQVCQKSHSLLKECYENILKETKMRFPVQKPEILGGELPQVVHWEINDRKELSNFPQSCQDIFENCKLKLKVLSGQMQENQLKFTKNIHKSNQCSNGGGMSVMLKNRRSSHDSSKCPPQVGSPRPLNFNYAIKFGKRSYRRALKFQCKNCAVSFSDLNRLKRHCRMTHRISESELTEDDLNNKVQMGQSETVNFFCVYCVPHKQFHTQKQLLKHLEECHKVKQTKGGPVLYSCAHCTYATFMTRVSLSQHMQSVHRLREDDVTWNDVKCVSGAQKSHSGTESHKVCSSHQKSNPAAEPVSCLQEKSLCSEVMHDSFANSKKLCESEKREDGSTETWICSECPASYSRKQSLHCHMREKHNRVSPGATKCPECSEVFLTNRRLIQHGISVHQKYFAWFHQVFKKVLQPEKKEYREKNFECDICGKKYIYKTSLRKHILCAHLKKSPQAAVTCAYCGKTLSNKLNLKSHIEFVHEALFVSCPICKKKINFRTIGRHYKTHRTNADGVFPGSNFVCSLCGKVLKSKRSFEDHQKLHQNIRDEICDVCGSGFTTKKLLRLHKKTHEGAARKMFACDQCEKVFSGRHTLNRHLLTHSGKKNFICEICSKCFYTIQELNRHVRYHKKDYKFDCQLCDMRFLCKSRFRHHMMKHRNIRPHKCQFCDKMFIERAKMNIHMTAKHNVVVHRKKAVWKDPKTYIPLNDLL